MSTDLNIKNRPNPDISVKKALQTLDLEVKSLQSQVKSLENKQYFTENSDKDIYTEKNVVVGAKKNIDEANFYSETMSVNRVIQAIKLNYDSIVINNSVVNEILSNIEKIKSEGFSSVLDPYSENNYYENINYYQVTTVPTVEYTDKNFYNNKILYSYKRYKNYTDKTLGSILNSNNLGEYIYYPEEGVDLSNVFNLNLTNLKGYKGIGLENLNYFVVAPRIESEYQVYFSCCVRIPGINSEVEGVDPDLIVVQSCANLTKILVGINETVLFQSENVKFFYKIMLDLLKLEGTYKNLKKGITDPIRDFDYNLWTYNTAAPSLAICKYSSVYPDWIGKPANQLVIIGTDINVAKVVTNIFNFNSKNLLISNEEQVGMIEYSYNSQDYLFLTKIIILDGVKQIITTQIRINDYFVDAIKTNGDMTVEGTLTVNNWDGSNVFNLHTEDKVLQVNGKIGINTQEPGALIDINSISTIEVDIITLEYTDLNKYIFGYYDYFINNYSTTENRNWTEIYNTYILNEKISVTTINLPFDFMTTNSTDESFINFSNNFNNYVYFGYTETEFKEKFEGKTASEISDPYYKNYFYALKDYFLIMWNQKPYYLLNTYQTFTNIVNYFGGPVLRMQVMWYDEQYNVIRLFASNLKLDKYLLNAQLNEILSNYYDSLFACEQLVNIFSNLLRDPIIQIAQTENPLYITNYIANSYYKQRFGYPQNYVTCWTYEETDYNEITELFFEAVPYWYNNKLSKVQIPGQDVLASNAAQQIIEYTIKNFDNKILERIMISFYFWSYEYKVSYVKRINILGKDYYILSGVNILEYIKKNIISNGDQQFNGSLKILDSSNNQTILTVDTTEKQVAIQYPVGLGTENPRSILTIDDVSLSNLFDYLADLTKKNRYITDLAKQLRNAPSEDYRNIIDSYIDPFTGKKYVQDVDNYFAVVNPDDSNINNIGKYEYEYHWYLKEWEGVLYKDVLNPNFNTINNGVKPLAGNFFLESPLKEVMYKNTLNLKIYNWIWGRKVSTSKYFLDLDNTIRFIHTGVNFNIYFSRFNSNKNLQNIIFATKALQVFLNELYLNYIGQIPLNQLELEPYIESLTKQYTKFTLWVMDYPTDYNKTRLYLNQNGDLPTNLNNLSPTDTIFDMLYNFETSNHGNLTFKQILLFYQKIINLQQKIQFYNGQEKDLEISDSNILGYRTDEDYWLANWIYIPINTVNPSQAVNVITILEFNADDYLNQSVQMIGDLQMGGNLTLMNPIEYLKYVKNGIPLSDLNPIVSVYPNEKFVGVGSQEIYTQYPVIYSTLDILTNRVFARNNMLVSNNSYPNLIAERFADPKIPDDEYFLQNSFSCSTQRRSTKLYTLEQIVDLGKGKYGMDISFEVQDKYQDTYELAQFGVKVEKLRNFNGINYPVPKYTWNIIDSITPEGNLTQKTLMSLESESRLTVEKIKLGSFDLTVEKVGNKEVLKWGSVILGEQPTP